MAVTVLKFISNYPDFKNTDEFLIKQKLRLARLRVNEATWGDNYDDGVMLMVAHLLSISPAGEKVRLSSGGPGDIYKKEFDEMRLSSTFGRSRVS